MMSLPEPIREALQRPVVYGREYSDRVIGLKEALEAKLQVVFVLDRDMNYNPAQSLTFALKGKDAPTKRAYAFDVRFYVSSKGPLFAVYCFDRKWGMTDHGFDHPIARERLPETARAWIEKADGVLKSSRLVEVEHRYFFVPAPGCTTQLDGSPATVFESLFAEIV